MEHVKDFLEKAKNLLIATLPQETSEERKTKESILEIAVEEQRRVYDKMFDNYQQVKSRTLVFLAAGFALMTFLYASGDIFFPKQTYGQIFYLAALGLVIFGFCALFIALQAARWEYPTEKSRLQTLDFPSKVEYLEYIKDRYILCYTLNVTVCEKKHMLLRISFYPLIIGATILVLLKIFKENI